MEGLRKLAQKIAMHAAQPPSQQLSDQVSKPRSTEERSRCVLPDDMPESPYAWIHSLSRVMHTKGRREVGWTRKKRAKWGDIGEECGKKRRR